MRQSPGPVPTVEFTEMDRDQQKPVVEGKVVEIPWDLPRGFKKHPNPNVGCLGFLKHQQYL